MTLSAADAQLSAQLNPKIRTYFFRSK